MQHIRKHTQILAVVTGIICGILLALLQVKLWNSDSASFGQYLLLTCLSYTLGPGLAAFFITRLTRQTSAGYTAGMLTGLLCVTISACVIVIDIKNSGPWAELILFFALPFISIHFLGIFLSFIGIHLGTTGVSD